MLCKLLFKDLDFLLDILELFCLIEHLEEHARYLKTFI
jgi:hypothetical protein